MDLSAISSNIPTTYKCRDEEGKGSLDLTETSISGFTFGWVLLEPDP